MLRILTPWDSQPQEATDVDRENPLTRGLVDILPAWRRRTASGNLATTQGTVADSVAVDGRSLLITGAGVNDDNYGGEWSTTSAPMSALAFYKVNTIPAGTSRLFSNFSSVTRGWMFSPNAANFRVLVASAGVNTTLTGSAIATGRKIDIFTTTGTSTAYWENGVLTASNASHAAMAGPLGNNYVGSDGTTASVQADYYLFGIWNRVLADAEIREITRNPWQLFAPRSIWVPVSSSASGTSYTITPSGGITLSGSGTEVNTKVLAVSGGVTFAGTGSMAFATTGTTYTISPSGGITFAGTGVQVRSKTIAPEGGFTFSGSGLDLRTKIIDISGGVTFGGTGSMTSNTSVVTGTVGERTKVGVGT